MNVFNQCTYTDGFPTSFELGQTDWRRRKDDAGASRRDTAASGADKDGDRLKLKSLYENPEQRR